MWLESPLTAGSIRDLPRLPVLVDITVLPRDVSVGVLGLDLEGAVSCLVTVAVGAVVVVTVNLLENGHWGGRRALGLHASPRRAN